jgi:putative ABC transport system permease protein
MNRSIKLFEGASRDVRYAGRMVRKRPLFSLAIVVTVALGIGANATIFGVINAVLLEPLPYKDPDRLVRLWESNLGKSQPESPVSVPNFQDWQQQQSVFEEVAALEMATYNITGWGEPQRVASARITANLIPALGVAPALGRSFLPEEEKTGNNRVVLLSDGLWQRQFGADRSIINQTIRLNGESYTVVGVMPAGFQFPVNREIWVPLTIDPQKEPWRADRTNRNLSVFGRLKSGVSFNQAVSDMDNVAQRLEQQYAESNTGWRVRMKTFYDWIVPKEVRTAMFGLFVGVSLLLLIACVNVANLLLADATKRQQEMAMRAALGASPSRLIRQLLIESLLLAGLGGLLGLGLAFWATKVIAAANMQNIARLSESGIDGYVLVFTFVITTITGLFFGLAPAWLVSRVNLTDRLKEGSGSDGGRVTHRLRSALVIAEVTMAAAVLVGAGLLVSMLARLQAVPLGFTPDNVFTMQISLPGAKYSKRDQRVNFFDQLLQRLRAVPGVIDTAAVEQAPGSLNDWTMEIMLVGADAAITETRSSAEAHAITPGYFKTMGIPFLQGQDFSPHYRVSQPLEYIVSERFARRYWPNESAIGKRFRPSTNNPVGTVVGIVGDVHTLNSQQDATPAFYFPYGYVAMPAMVVLVHTTNQPETFATALRAEVRQIDSDQPVYNMKTMNEIVASATAQQRFQAVLSSLFAIAALLLVAVGIYSVVAYMVKQRRREIGVRMAVGASTHNIIRMVIAQGMRNVLVGLALGLAGSSALTRLIGSSVFGLTATATDLRIYLLVALVLVGVAFIACYLPAWRATKIDPSLALRVE